MSQPKIITLEEYKKKLGYDTKTDVDKIQEIECLWDYPLSELNYCQQNNIEVVAVKLDNEIRLFEVH